MRKILLFFLLMTLASCKQGSQIVYSEYTIQIDSLSESFPAFSKLTYVPLETTESSLIYEIDKILYLNHTIYIFDKENKKILLFNDKGKFLNAICQVGQGPGEYVYPSDMDVDEFGNVYVLDFSSKRIIKYKKGNEKDFELLNIGEYVMDFAVMGGTVFLGRGVKNGKFTINLASWNRDDNVFRIIDEDEAVEGNKISYSSAHYFFRSGNEINYYARFHPTIYQLSCDTLKEYISFYSERNPTPDMVKELSRKSIPEQLDVDYIRDVSACFETDDYIFITFQALPPVYSLIHKNTGKSYHIHGFQGNNTLGMGAFASTGKEFISYCIPTQENKEKIISIIQNMTTEEQNIFQNLKEEDNPILIFFKFD